MQMKIKCACGHVGDLPIPWGFVRVECSRCGATLVDDLGPIRPALVIDPIEALSDPFLTSLYEEWEEEEVERYADSVGVAELYHIICSLPYDLTKLNITGKREPTKNYLEEERAFCAYLAAYKIEGEFKPAGYVKMQIGSAVERDVVEKLVRRYGGKHEPMQYGTYDGIVTRHHPDWTNGERLVELKTQRWYGHWMAKWVAGERVTPKKWLFTIPNVRRQQYWYWVQSALYGYWANISPVNVMVVDVIGGDILNDYYDWERETTRATVEAWLNHIKLVLPELPLPREWELKRATGNWLIARPGYWCGSCPLWVKGKYDELGNFMEAPELLVEPYQRCPKFANQTVKNRVKWR